MTSGPAGPWAGRLWAVSEELTGVKLEALTAR
jgi:hypothetical protein